MCNRLFSLPVDGGRFSDMFFKQAPVHPVSRHHALVGRPGHLIFPVNPAGDIQPVSVLFTVFFRHGGNMHFPGSQYRCFRFPPGKRFPVFLFRHRQPVAENRPVRPGAEYRIMAVIESKCDIPCIRTHFPDFLRPACHDGIGLFPGERTAHPIPGRIPVKPVDDLFVDLGSRHQGSRIGKFL